MATPADRLLLPSPAKLNLFLRITGRRSDGYHALQTLFQLLEFGDSIILQAHTDGVLALKHAIPGVAAEDNLAMRAARLLQKHTGSTRGALIAIDKRLPMGGGLGGGSSNAATVLLGLNRLWGLDLALDELAALGLQLGADVPVFVHGRNSLAGGIGEKLSPLHTGPAFFTVLVPQVNISTASIFARRELTRDSHAIRIPADFGSASSPVALADWPRGNALPADALRNDCEPVVRALYPEVDNAINLLSQFGNARLTGTGGCVFAGFASKALAEAALQAMPAGIDGFVSAASNYSGLHRALGIAGA
ncbi:MAG: 4-(cytidine 5'-diphospho)-2-C-methyl-D-erythritol kinase [Pseudomonadales bacterium]